MTDTDLGAILLAGHHIGFTELCPCTSGRTLARCCLLPNRRIRKTPVSTLPRRRLIYSHPRCYASKLGSCSGKISGEHYFTKAILEYLDRHGVLNFRGFIWQKEGSPRLSIKALQSNILCGKHNRALSPLDGQAIRFFRSLAEPGPTLALFSGHDLERWLLKMLCGLLASKSLARNPTEPFVWNSESPWLDSLFGTRPFPSGTGLFRVTQTGDRIPTSKRMTIAPLSRGDEIAGVQVALCGFQFMLTTIPPHSKDPLFKNARHRPTDFSFKWPNAQETTIAISW